MDSKYSSTNTSVSFSIKIGNCCTTAQERDAKVLGPGNCPNDKNSSSDKNSPRTLASRSWAPKNETLKFSGPSYNLYAKILGRINRQLVGKKLRWFVTMIRSSITELPEYENIWYESSNQEKFPETNTILRFYIDYKKLVKFDLTLKDIAETVFYDTPWHASPDWMGMIDLDIGKNNTTHVLSKIDTLLCGNSSISAMHADIDTDEHNNITVKAVTAGSDIVSVSQLLNIDKLTIHSNHVLDVYKNFGIEAAATALRKIIGSDVISDFMTRTGIVLPFYNSSPEVFKKGSLTAMAFERPRTHLQKFLRSSSWDTHPSIYADIMVGNNPEHDFSISSLTHHP